MEAELQSHVAFHLTGKRPAGDLEAVDELALTPVQLARYRDLTGLRYDYPVVLAPDGTGPVMHALSAVIDRVLQDMDQGDDGERISRHAFRLEAALRKLLAGGAGGTLSSLWEKAVADLGATGDDLLADSLARLRKAVRVDGELVDCDTSLAPRAFELSAGRVYVRKAAHFSSEVQRLIQKLTDILRADFAHSGLGRSGPSLRAALGGLHEDAFDFDVMSTLLMEATPESAMPASRRTRINGLLYVLQNQRFFAVQGSDAKPYGFTFTSCQEALAAYRERLPEVTELARTIEVAELEVAGEYRDARHDAFFAAFDENDVDPDDLALFPDYCVITTAGALYGVESTSLMEMLSSGLPVKVLVQTDDVLEEGHPGEGHIGFAARARQLAHMAMAGNEVFVLQASASHLYQSRERIRRAMEFRGPAFVSVYCPNGVTTPGLTSYLVAAAAMESRVFPTFTFDPSAGADLASRIDIRDNPQAERDWPVQAFAYENAQHQRVTDDLAFTAIDFIACDVRFTRHFARVPKHRWSDAMVHAGEALARTPERVPGVLPCAWLVDRELHLQKVLVDEKLMREARRCRAFWRSLQELGGVHNSHAQRLLARERQTWEEQHKASTPEARVAPAAVAANAAAATATATAVQVPEPVAEAPSDDPYIETPRCTTCNECTNLNDKMFGYNENKQATIVNPDAGTYAQLVEAAENCQVSIIHPGKPRNPDEPDLEALIERAKPFL